MFPPKNWFFDFYDEAHYFFIGDFVCVRRYFNIYSSNLMSCTIIYYYITNIVACAYSANKMYLAGYVPQHRGVILTVSAAYFARALAKMYSVQVSRPIGGSGTSHLGAAGR